MYNDDQAQSITLAKQVLEKYVKYKRRSKQFPTIGSPVSDGMPTGSSDGSSQESKLVRYADDPAKRYCELCESLVDDIEKMESQECAMALRKYYFSFNATVTKISIEMHISRPTFYKIWESALYRFGERVNPQQFKGLENEYIELRSH